MKGFTTISIFLTTLLIQQGDLVRNRDGNRNHQPHLSQSTNSTELIKSVNKFTWNLFHNSKLPGATDNLVISPVMIQLLLSVLEKASTHETKRQLINTIGSIDTLELNDLLHEQKTSRSQIETAAGIFIDNSETIYKTFANQMKRDNIDLLSVNFKDSAAAKKRVNDWASDATHGLIKNLLGEAYNTEDLRMLLTTAIYFHSTWKYRFNRSMIMPFYSSNGVGKDIPFMELKQELVWEEIVLDYKISGSLVEIPYQNEDYSMVILLPDPQFSLDTFIRSMTLEKFNEAVRSIFVKKPKYITLKMPKFTISSRFSVVNPLLKMGLVDLFTINSKLPNIGLTETPTVNDIVQQAVITVDENGTTAAAAAASFLIPLSADSNDARTVTVDAPFLAIIIDRRTSIPLFISKIYQP